MVADTEQRLVNSTKHTRLYPPGAYVYRAGEVCRGIHCIESGTIALRMSDAQGNTILVGLAHRRQTLGYQAFFNGREHHTTAQALTDSLVCHVDGEVMERVLARNPALHTAFTAHISRDLAETQENLLRLAALPVRARLAHLLCSLAPHYGRCTDAGETLLELPMNQRVLAELLGTRRETVARTLHALQTEGLLRFRRARLVIPDTARLEAEADPPE